MNANKKIGFFSGIKQVFSFKPYVLLLLLELFSWLAIQVGNECLLEYSTSFLLICASIGQ